MFGLFNKWDTVIQEVLITEYKNDKTFKKRYDKALGIITKYEIVKPTGAVKVFTDFGIDACLTEGDLPIGKKNLKQYHKMPFADYVRK